MMGFVAVTARCLGCKASLPKAAPGEREIALCPACAPRKVEVYLSKVQAYGAAEKAFHETLVTCQRVTGDNYKDVVGIARDSTLYYKMKKVRKDLKEAQEVLARFPR